MLFLKKEIRRRLRDCRNQLSEDEIITKSRCITNTLIQSELFKKSGSLFAYLETQNEVLTRPLIEHCFRIGKPVYVPVTQKNEIFFTRLNDFSNLVEADFGILEPKNPIAEEPDENSLFIIPGVGFDQFGTRLGYGAGFYDRYLYRREALSFVGVCFEIQLADKLPKEETDVLMDSVLTEKRWLIVDKKNREL